jgi:hypothetical protein
MRDIELQITNRRQAAMTRPARSYILTYVIFEVLTTMTMKNGVFWDVTPCGSCRTNVSGNLGLPSSG